MAKGRAKKCEILVLNNIAQVGLKRFPAEQYAVVKEAKDPQAILVRSADLHRREFGPSLKAVGRAGAGVNNIPVAALSKRGVPVFNAPGANANAVKELVLAGMLLAARNLPPALDFVRGLKTSPQFEEQVEDGKKQFAGSELPGHTLGIIGLGKIGSLVADAAIRLGMNVLGYDPHITVDAAWSLPSQVRKAGAVDEVLKQSHFVSLHVPLGEKTRHMIDARNIEHFRAGAVLLNFSRDGVVADDAVVKGLNSHRLRWYVTDFPSAGLVGHAGVIALPRIGASTREAEDNSAIMVVDQLRDYLEHGNLQNAVNFPDAAMAREAPYRLAIANANVPDMLGAISHALGRGKINIHNMLNKSKGEMAYTLVDADSPVPAAMLDELGQLKGVQAVRKHFGRAVEGQPSGSVDEAFRRCESGAVQFAVVPVENSTEGAVGRTLDLLLATPLRICAEIELRVQQNLLFKGEILRSVRRVYSHAQSLAQCNGWLAQNLPGAERVPVASNAEAAQRASTEEGAAAIAGEAAAERYRLNVLARSIEDAPNNTTRFLVLGNLDPAPTGNDRTSLVMSAENRPGAVHALLTPLAQNRASMSRIESRPSRARAALWEYMFFIDIEGHQKDPGVAAALAELRSKAPYLKILGSYPSAC